MKQTFEGEDLPGGGLGKPLQADLTGQGQAHPTAAQQKAHLAAARVLKHTPTPSSASPRQPTHSKTPVLRVTVATNTHHTPILSINTATNTE